MNTNGSISQDTRGKRIFELEDLGRLATTHHLRVFPTISPMPPAPLLASGPLSSEIIAEHNIRGEAVGVDVVALVDLQLGGFGIMMNSEGQVITPKAFCPGYLPSMLAKAVSLASSQRSPAQRMWLGGMLDSAVEVLKSDVPVAVPFHPNFVYGHFLLEMLPKLLVLDQLHQMGAHFPIAMSTHTPAWARQIVSDLWRNRTILWYDSEKQVVRAPALILPSGPAVGHAMHPAFSSIDHFCARRLGMALPQQSTCASGRLIYLSRTKMPVTWHRIENEQEIETAFSELGFEIIHPQELSFCQQIELMASARVVAGEFSSALHNTLFAPIGTPVIALNWINWYQSRACALRQQPLAIVLPTDSNVRDHRSRGLSGKVTFSVDPTSVRQIVARVHELYCSP